MKKSKVFIILTLVCCIMLISLAACNDPGSDANALSKDEQIKEFKHIITTVLGKFDDRKAESEVSLAKLSANNGKGFTKSTAVQQIFDIMDSVEDKDENEEGLLNHTALFNFIAARAYGELISNACAAGDVDKFYGVPMSISMEDSVPSTAYIVVVAKGTHRIVYLYGKDEVVGEMVYMYDIDYASDDSFSAKMIMLSMQELKTDADSALKSNAYYFYGDTDGNSLLMSGSWNQEFDDEGVIGYKKTSDIKGYNMNDLDVANNCFSKVKDDYKGIDLTLIRSLKESCKFSAESEEYLEIVKNLCEEYGV